MLGLLSALGFALREGAMFWSRQPFAIQAGAVALIVAASVLYGFALWHAVSPHE